MKSSQIIICEFTFQKFDPVQMEFNSLSQLEKFLNNNACFARALTRKTLEIQSDQEFTAILKTVLKVNGEIEYRSFTAVQDLKNFLND